MLIENLGLDKDSFNNFLDQQNKDYLHAILEEVKKYPQLLTLCFTTRENVPNLIIGIARHDTDVMPDKHGQYSLESIFGIEHYEQYEVDTNFDYGLYQLNNKLKEEEL